MPWAGNLLRPRTTTRFHFFRTCPGTCTIRARESLLRWSGDRSSKASSFKLGTNHRRKCKEKIDGKVELSLLVDTSGHARNITFLRPLGTELDSIALRIAEANQLSAGTLNGNLVVVAESLLVTIQTCRVKTKEGAGAKTYEFKLRTTPVEEMVALPNFPEYAVLTSGTLSQVEANNAREHFEQVGVSTTAPIPLTQPRAEYTDAASKAKINGTCLISLVVDRQGMPQAMKVEKTLDPGLDQNALSAVSRYRFKPAMRDGEPVPMYVNIEVNFLLLP